MIHLLLLVTTTPWLPDAEFQRAYKGYDACFELRDLDTGETRRFNAKGCGLRLSPCSTYKIPNSLIALQTGVAKDASHPYKWDGTKHPNRPKWDKDQTMATAIQESVVWYYERLAKDIGPQRMRTWVHKIGYGNRSVPNGWRIPFWLDGTLKISADEQVAFLSDLLNGKLPFAKRNVGILDQITRFSSGPAWTLNGKTGSGSSPDGKSLGWYVGWVRSGHHRYAFAGNIRGAKESWGPKAREITVALLAKMKLIKPE